MLKEELMLDGSMIMHDEKNQGTSKLSYFPKAIESTVSSQMEVKIQASGGWKDLRISRR